MLRERLLTIELLRLLRSAGIPQITIANKIGKPVATVSRYTSGQTIPSYDTAKVLNPMLVELIEPALREHITRSIERNRGLIDLSRVLGDPWILRGASMYFYMSLRHREPNKILVPETSGIPLATALSFAFEAPLIVARRERDNPYEEYTEASYIEAPRSYTVFYVPRNSISKGDRVLIVDDIVESGRTLAVMKKLVEKSRASIAGIAALVVVGSEWKKRAELEDEDITYVVYVGKTRCK